MSSTPEERYRKVTKKILPNGKTVYGSVLPKTIRGDSLTDVILTANEDDRLDVIAQNAYGAADQWWRIACANRNVNGSLYLKPGTLFIIPK